MDYHSVTFNTMQEKASRLGVEFGSELLFSLFSLSSLLSGAMEGNNGLKRQE